MQKLTTEEIQKECLGIMKYIHTFCENRGIKYILTGGSMIGAVRHKGFIPWDDDLDIVMLRPDYDRFCAEFEETEKFKIYSPARNNTLLFFTRVCEVEKTTSDICVPWTKGGQTGVSVDIMPYDAVENDFDAFMKRVAELRSLQQKMFLKRLSYWKFSQKKGIVEKMKLIYHKIVGLFIDDETLQKEYEKLRSAVDYGTSTLVGNIAWLGYAKKERVARACFDSYILMDFCGERFWLPAGYDEILRNFFGDYMQLPPEEKRIPSHQNAQCFYWKESK